MKVVGLERGRDTRALIVGRPFSGTIDTVVISLGPPQPDSQADVETAIAVQ